MKYGKRGKSGGFTKKGSPDKSMISAGVGSGLSSVSSIHYADSYNQNPEVGRQQRTTPQSAISSLRHVEHGPSGSLGKNPG